MHLNWNWLQKKKKDYKTIIKVLHVDSELMHFFFKFIDYKITKKVNKSFIVTSTYFLNCLSMNIVT